jgi:drug/metabolite transporter (DMT)-like permease
MTPRPTLALNWKKSAQSVASTKARLQADRVTFSLHLYNKRHDLRTYLVLIWFIGLRAFGNLSLAWGARHVTEELAFNPSGYLRAAVNPYVVGGIVMLMASLLTRMALFSVADLSFVLPMTSIGYVLAVGFGKVFLHEHVSAARWVGAFLIFAATALVGSTPQNTTPVADYKDQQEGSLQLRLSS